MDMRDVETVCVLPVQRKCVQEDSENQRVKEQAYHLVVVDEIGSLYFAQQFTMG